MGDMNSVQKHTFELARRTYLQMKKLRHPNGSPLVKFYCDTNFIDPNTQGSIINFNLLRHNGEYVGYSEVRQQFFFTVKIKNVRKPEIYFKMTVFFFTLLGFTYG